MATNQSLAVFRSRRGWTVLSVHFSIAFAALAGVVQLILTVRPVSLLQGADTLLGIAALSCCWALARSLPREAVEHGFKNPDFSVVVKVGDLFDEPSDLVIGFTDVFDTDTEDDSIIAPRTVQGQLLARVFDGDVPALDAALMSSLSGARVCEAESRESKPKGKLDRYPVGTVAVVPHGGSRFYCVAYSHMSNDLIAQSSVDSIWQSLGNLWSAIGAHGHLEPVAVPILGSDLAKVGSLGRESLLKMIILSFVAASRASLVSRQLTVVVHPDDADEVNLLEVRAFLTSL
ncbi:DUF6430 domain-containing protein [Streptomyces cinnabarinus]|uniref:DUF6430 domain-containing protein n=1 Tax=Streptomyces cinnabarinus TaxID=67287 RepID=A0ABY7KC43_9ACTN|nr:macro domain-containing protein [Streptomyces cinnabarinus]WAZ21310.1 DUF6430 domain-containing protein [Streptomyces cinnabarinus]